MQTSANLEQAIKQLEQQILKETREMNDKEAELKKAEPEMTQLKKDIELKTHQLKDLERRIPILKHDIDMIKREQQHLHDELAKIHTSYTNALQQSGMKVR